MTAAIVFLDRDGTLNVDSGYVCSPERLQLIDGAASAVALLRRSGFKVVIVTNQSAIGRGIASEAQVAATNKELQRQLAAADAEAVVDRVLLCPHGPDEGCRCRKPLIGMLDGLDFDPQRSWMVGDKLSDLAFGQNAGIPVRQQILVRTGEGEKELERAGEGVAEALRSAADVLEAARLIAAELRS